MRSLLYCLLLIAPLRGAAPDIPSQSTPVTVLLDFENPHAGVPLREMESELASILSSAGVRLDLRLRDTLPAHSEFRELVIFKMKGHCGADALPVAALSDERGPLAMTYSSDGTILSFGAVECDNVRRSLQHLFREENLDHHELAYGRALGRVVAHEMYHMMGNCQKHTKNGVTKKSFTPRDLSEGSLRLPNDAKELLRKRIEGDGARGN